MYTYVYACNNTSRYQYINTLASPFPLPLEVTQPLPLVDKVAT